ncbi:MAG: type II toxin-antitoxin system ParD family antitoxin [Acidobacteria bacterium]|nr:type II toxin-antitoxin system ParD family antitoxin [Acidobacteriota bacterium]
MATTTTMNISLPDTMKAFVEERLANDGYGTISEYIRELIRADQKRREEEKLEALLLQRLQGDQEFEFEIDAVRTELAKRLGKKKK